MPPNPFWTIWIYSSLVVYFKTLAKGVKLPLFVSGDLRDPSIVDFCEFRMSGPNYNELTSGYWYIDLHIALLSTMVPDENNLYKQQQIAGQMLNMFSKDIPVFRQGTTGPESDKSILGCLRLKGELIQNIYGQIQIATPVSQASIEAHYHMELCFIEEKLTKEM